MTYTLRPTTPADAPTVHAVMMSAGMDPRSSWVRTTVADVEWSLGTGGGVLALQQGAAVGCVGWRPDGFRTLTLNKLATRPEVRGLGLGAALVRAVEERARAGGFERVLLAVSQYNLSVIPFYEHLGYMVSTDRYAYAHPDSPAPVVLVKQSTIKADTIGISPAISKEMKRLKIKRKKGAKFTEIAQSIETKNFTSMQIILIFKEAFQLPLKCAVDAMAYVFEPSDVLLNQLADCPEWVEQFGVN